MNKLDKKNASLWLRKLTKNTKRNIYLTVAISLLSGLCLIFQAYFLALIANNAYLKQMPVDKMLPYFGFIIIFFIVRSILTYLKEIISFRTSEKIRNTLRKEIIEHIKNLGPTQSKAFSSGKLISFAIEQIEALHNYLVYYLPQISIAVFLPLMILVFIFPVSITCAIILLICAPLIPLFMALVGMGAETVHQRNFQNLALMSHHFLDILSGLTTLKLFAKAQAKEKEIYQVSDNYRITTMKVLKIAFLSSAVLEVFAAVSIAFVATYLGMGFLNKGVDSHLWWSLTNMHLTGALFILLLAPEFFFPLRELSTHYHAKAEAVGASVELKKLFDLKPEIVDKENTNSLINLFKHIEFKAISVQYQNNIIPSLDHFNLKVKANETVIFLGPSGAGKSTVLNLLMRFIKPQLGEIVVDDNPLNMINKNNWLEKITWLGQNPRLFSGSILDNLKMAKPNAKDIEINHVLKLAQLAALIKTLPDGLNTQVGDNNLGISGGQAQRIALARALLKDAPILLFDEPTASLDPDYEHLIFDTIKHFKGRKTIFMATHKLEHLEMADQLIILDQGKIIQQGTFSELKAHPKGYLNELLSIEIKKVDA